MSDSEERPTSSSDGSGGGPEVRIGLVLYGGVSLAIYMYGVVQEVWRLVRASQALDDGKPERLAAEADNPWLEVVRAAGVSVRVDIISGASAGGINGILLGKALVDGADLDVAEDIWLDTAAIRNLLRPVLDRDPGSVLDSQKLRDELEEGLREMGAHGGWPRLTDVFDLFVSTTNLEGVGEEFEDDVETVLPTNRHRAPVNLRLRDAAAYAQTIWDSEGKSRDYVEADRDHFDDLDLLSRLGAATSAFPVAFEPVEVEEATATRYKGLGVEWPAGFYSDGGILDNKPFTEMIGKTFARAADTEVSRWLVSVDPDTQTPDEPSGQMPNFISVASAAVMKIPRYESIAEDLQRLRVRNREVNDFWEKAWQIELELTATVSTPGVEGDLYTQQRRRSLVAYLVRERLRFLYPDGAELAERMEVVDAVTNALKATASAAEIDVAYEIRKAYYLVRLLDRAEPTMRANANEARTVLWRRIEVLRSAVWEAVGEVAVSLKRLRAPVATAGKLCGELPDLRVGAHEEVPIRASCEEYEERDRRLIVLDYAGIDTGHGRVKHAQISAASATAISEGDSALKLAGDTAGHFGGFLSHAWRKNDMRWGRLDAAEILTKLLAKESPVEGSESWTVDVLEDIAASEGFEGDDWREQIREQSLGRATVTSIGRVTIARLGLRIAVTLRTMFANVESAARRGLFARIKGWFSRDR